MKIKIVDDQACPQCNAIFGHPDKNLNFPNRPKVGDKQNRWWWKCCNPNCNVGYYLPETGEIELKPTPEEHAEMIKRVKEYVDSIDFDKIKVTLIE
jgi:hypothetical protein